MASNSDKSTGGETGSKRTRSAPRKKRSAKNIENIEEMTSEDIVIRQSQPSAWSRSLLFSIRERDIVVFLRQLIMLLQAGTPILKSLKTLAARSERGSVRELINDIAQFVEMGNPLWQAFERHPHHFDSVFVNLIKASEASGTLVTVLDRVATYRERRQAFRKRVQSALVYPIVVVVACVAVIVLIGRFVMPEFQRIFEALDAPVPAFTEHFIATVNTITSWSFVLVVAVVIIALGVIYSLLVRNPVYRLRVDRIKLAIPFVGKNILRKRAVVEMTRSFSLLLGSGLSMMVTLDLTRYSIGNRAVGQVLQDVRDAVERGEGIEKPLRDARKIIPPVVTDMLVTGEDSGQMDKISGQIAEAYEEEVNIDINTLAELVPPVLALIMGIFVLTVALAVFVPLLQVLEQLQAAT